MQWLGCLRRGLLFRSTLRISDTKTGKSIFICIVLHKARKSMMIVYRLLRSDEDPGRGLKAKDPYASVSVEDHVAYGSSGWINSQYISCCKTINTLRYFLSRSRTFPRRVVRIDLSLADTFGLDIIDLTCSITRMQYLLSGRAQRFAIDFEEVLVCGYIPPQLITYVNC